MSKIEIYVPGDPKPQKRHRHVSKGKFVTTYDPSKKDKEIFLKACLGQLPKKPLEGPLRVWVIFSFKRPASHYGTGRNSGNVKASAPKDHTKVPDLDNLVKFVWDTLNKNAWKDDSQINTATLQKGYSTELLLEPGTYITIRNE